jgi:hypothetical protein
LTCPTDPPPWCFKVQSQNWMIIVFGIEYMDNMAKKGLLGLPLCRICLKKIYWATTRQERRNVSIKNSIGYLYTSSLGIWESGFGRCIFIRQSGI